jgi:4,5-DOPA dioxygenase extradiol
MTTTTAAADALVPATHPFAATCGVPPPPSRQPRTGRWAPEDGPLPSLYISHGAPPVFEDTTWMTELHDWARRLPKPKAVLVVSAHWESAPLSITSTSPTELVYDFGGFDPLYTTMRYDTPDAGELAGRSSGCCRRREPFHEHVRRARPRAWVPLKGHVPGGRRARPAAEHPHARQHAAARPGARLRALRDEGACSSSAPAS